ncbi:MAG: hypothetical protein KKB50_02340 [Planctomycetes bacterium]|nr:hypothetical protein [Planctomycetota bacterium]
MQPNQRAATGETDDEIPAGRPVEPGLLRDRAALFLLVIGLAWQIVAAVRPLPWVLHRLTFDDTYLALQVARGWVAHGFPSFDGLHRTNGFQALWGLSIYGLALLVRDPVLLVRVTLVVSAGLNTVSGALLWRVGRTLFPRTTTALWILAFWTAYCLCGRPATIGLDTPLVGPILAGTLLVFQRLRAAPLRLRNWCALAVLLGLGVWARLDAAVIVAVIWASLGVWAARRGAWAGYTLGTAPLGLLAIVLIAFNYWAGQTPTPVSGLVKHMIATRLEPEWSVGLLAQISLEGLHQFLKHLAYGVGAVWPPALSSITRGVIIVIVGVALWRRCVRVSGWVVVWVVALLSHVFAIRLWLGAYHCETIWYYGPEQVSAAVWLGVCCAALFERVAGRGGRLRWPVLVGVARLPVALVLLLIPPQFETVALNQYASALWLREHTGPDAPVAAWNAGHVAYFSERSVVNLDGLVNDVHFYELLKSSRADEAYLDELGVVWVVDQAKFAADAPGTYWGWLPHENWEAVALIGDDPGMQQLIVRRRSAPVAQ